MQLTRHTDYALRLLTHVASISGGKSSIGEIAQIHRISRNHLMKVVQALSHGGFLTTYRGRGGGFSLARPAEEITMGEIIRFTEPNMDLADCAHCQIAPVCQMTSIFNEARDAFLAVFDRYSLADASNNTPAYVALLTLLKTE